MKNFKRSIVLGLLLTLLSGLPAGADDAAGSNKLKYKFAVGDSAKYRLKLRHEVKIEGEERADEVVTQSYVFAQKVEKVRASGVSLSLTFPEVRVKFGLNSPEFDSRNKEHIAAAKQENSGWRVFGALLTTKVSMRIKETGEVAFFRVKELAAEYDDERTRFYAEKAIDTVKTHAFLVLPGVKAEKGAVWNTNIPVRFIGGPLSGQDVYVPVALKLKKIDEVQGKRQAVFEVSSYEQPALEMLGDSLKGVEVKLKAEKMTGSVTFSIDDGTVKNYSFNIETSMKLSVSGEVMMQHNMKVAEDFSRL